MRLTTSKIDAIIEHEPHYAVLRDALHATYQIVAGDLLAAIREMSPNQHWLTQDDVIEASLDYCDIHGVGQGRSKADVRDALEWFDQFDWDGQQKIAKRIFPYKRYE